jgi:hypothetical protein
MKGLKMNTEEMADLISRVDERTKHIPEMRKNIGAMKTDIALLQASTSKMFVVKWPPVKYVVGVVVAVGSVFGYTFIP